jgi:predicted nucleic acid-binding protein
MSLIVDASVACKWFIAEADSDGAEALLTRDSALLAPDLIVPEVCNVACLKLRRGEITAAQAAAMVESLPDLLDELVPSVQLAARAFAIASSLAHPAYDCFYLALAELRDTRLVTADRRLVARLARTPWARLIVGLDGGAITPA